MTTIIMRIAAHLLTPVMVALSLYLLLRGHYAPGGGFSAALVTGLAIVFRTFALGPGSVERLLRTGAANLIGVGLLLAIGTGAAGWWWGDAFLEVGAWHLGVPAIGEVELSSALLFEVGVFLTVVAVVVAVLQELGRE
ncbi:MAG TPA: MnhB domain-containing protein [Nitriliruptorales bacterium]|nr:MnhB domain-containing protein [Nitriliruptorales bacterium]